MKTHSKNMALVAPPEPYGALIFDCDGTLADTMPNHFLAWQTALRSFGGDISEEQFYALGGMPTPDIIRLLNDQNGYGLDITLTHHEKERRYLELVQNVIEITAVAEIARANKDRVPMAVASGGMRSIVEATLDATHLRSLFVAVVTADDVTNGKPAPDIFLLAAERLCVPAADCIVYEDSDLGLDAARAAGMRFVDVRVLWE